MPLLDHFHPPLSAERRWESFHSNWATKLADALTERWLPPNYIAEEHAHLGPSVEIDVGTFEPEVSATREDGAAVVATVAIGQALGRLGCFSAGCCWGAACDTHYLFAAKFPQESLAYQSQAQNHIVPAGALTTIPIHPTQLYEALGCALIFLFLTWWRSRKRFHGELLALYLMMYAPLRALVETFRGDEERGRVFNFLGGVARHAWWNLSTSELISLGIFAAGVAIYVVQGRRTVQASIPAAA